MFYIQTDCFVVVPPPRNDELVGVRTDCFVVSVSLRLLAMTFLIMRTVIASVAWRSAGLPDCRVLAMTGSEVRTDCFAPFHSARNDEGGGADRLLRRLRFTASPRNDERSEAMCTYPPISFYSGTAPR